MRVTAAIIVLAILSIAAGCAVPPATTDRSLIEDIGRIKERQQNLSSQMEKLEDSLASMQDRLLEQERHLAELGRQPVAEKVTDGREKAEPQPAAPAEQPAVLPDAESMSPTEIYLEAFSDYAAGRYQEAIDGFGTFLELYPGSDYAANAQYWLGECYLALQQYEAAVAEFRNVLELYPDHAKAPDALLKAATALLGMEKPSAAAEAVRVLRARYPESAAAKKSQRDPRFTDILPE